MIEKGREKKITPTKKLWNDKGENKRGSLDI